MVAIPDEFSIPWVRTEDFNYHSTKFFASLENVTHNFRRTEEILNYWFKSTYT